MGKNFYICNKDGDVFQYIPAIIDPISAPNYTPPQDAGATPPEPLTPIVAPDDVPQTELRKLTVSIDGFFGDVPEETNPTRTMVITNTGNIPCLINQISLPEPYWRRTGPGTVNYPIILLIGESLTSEITFYPNNKGRYRGYIGIETEGSYCVIEHAEGADFRILDATCIDIYSSQSSISSDSSDEPTMWHMNEYSTGSGHFHSNFHYPNPTPTNSLNNKVYLWARIITSSVLPPSGPVDGHMATPCCLQVGYYRGLLPGNPPQFGTPVVTAYSVPFYPLPGNNIGQVSYPGSPFVSYFTLTWTGMMLNRKAYITWTDGWEVLLKSKEIEQEPTEAKTNYLFTSFQGVNDPVSAFACGSEVTAYTQNNNVLEKEVEEEEEQDVVFYVARNVSSEGNVILSCYSVTGEILSEHTLPIYEQILGLESWPKDGNTVVAISRNNVYVIDLSLTPPSILVSETSKPLARGLAYRSGEGNVAVFWVGVQGEFIGIGDLAVYKLSNANILMNVVPKKVSNNLLGFANSLDRLHAGFITELDTKESKTLLKDYTSGHNYIIPVSAIDIASPVRACAYLPVFEEEYSSIEIYEYDSSTGEKLTNSTPSTFGVIAAGSTSKTKVFRLNVPWAKRISNVKLGIIDADVRFVPGIVKFGTSPTFIPNYQPSEDFEGVNTASFSDDVSNKIVPVSNLSNLYNTSDFVYLSIEVPDRFFQPGHFQLKWFFDFEAEKEIPPSIPEKICEYNSETYSSESSVSSISSSSISSISSESSGLSYISILSTSSSLGNSSDSSEGIESEESEESETDHGESYDEYWYIDLYIVKGGEDFSYGIGLDLL